MIKKPLFEVFYIPTEVVFLRGCPYFLSGECKSTNWNLKQSPCVKCIENKVYNPLNAEFVNCQINNSR